MKLDDEEIQQISFYPVIEVAIDESLTIAIDEDRNIYLLNHKADPMKVVPIGIFTGTSATKLEDDLRFLIHGKRTVEVH